jgi:HEPN domain-containing protein
VKEMTARSLKTAEDDLTAAGLMFQNRICGLCIFHCQQALEKALKAIWYESQSDPPPKIHGLAALAIQLNLDLDEEKRKILQLLSEQYLSSHYPEFEVEYPLEAGDYYLQGAMEIFQWLRRQLNSIEQSQTS